MQYFYTSFLVILIAFPLEAQEQTLGTFINDSLAYNGYTLLAPTSSRQTYLIDNCGYEIHSWPSNFTPGLSCYLLENGDILRTARKGSSFNGGGTGGRIERISWDGELLWGWDYSNDFVRQHHDIEMLPNGNILLLAWELLTRERALALGRDPALLGNQGLWSEHIVEITPVGEDSAEIIWQWHAMDHLVQEIDETITETYGIVSENPQKINFNYVPNNGTDWLHCNGIDYHAGNDQIIVSSRNFSELWIIDHSTTRAEAAVDSGGIRGMGGDLVYRWGNPEAYGQGADDDQRLWAQHDPKWIENHLPDSGKISVFNNGSGRPGPDYSEVTIIEPNVSASGDYERPINSAHLPVDPFASIDSEGDHEFTSNVMSGTHQLPNGHFMVTDGQAGRVFELDYSGNVFWEYQNPVNNGGPLSQEETPRGTTTFRIERYGPDYPAFTDRELIPGELLEANPIDYGCQIYDGDIPTSALNLEIGQLSIFPNPTDGRIIIQNPKNVPLEIFIYDQLGRIVQEHTLRSGQNELDLSDLSGFYLIKSVHKLTKDMTLNRILVKSAH